MIDPPESYPPMPKPPPPMPEPPPRPRSKPGRKPTPPDVRALRNFVRAMETVDPARRAAAVRYLVGRYLPPEPHR